MSFLSSLVFFVIFLSFAMIPAFAANPTPYNEWDFDFIGIAVFQDPNNLNTLIISIPVVYNGEMRFGTVEVKAIVTEPDGKTKLYSDLIRDMKIAESQVVKFKHNMIKEGDYVVEISMTPPSDPHMEHIFDYQYEKFTIGPNGFENELGMISAGSDEGISYKILDGEIKLQYEVLHVVFNLPEKSIFEKITVINEEFSKDYPIDTKNIYLESETGFEKMQVYLPIQDNLLPTANAFSVESREDTPLAFVRFYAVDNKICNSVDCVNIDVPSITEQESLEFPVWTLGILAPVVIIGLYYTLKKCYKQKDYISNVSPSTEY